MKIGVVYPQTEYSTDPGAIRDFAQTAEELGFTHILTYDHILGANPDRPGVWRGPYTLEDTFMSPFLLFTYMAAFTSQIEFVTGIIILPQRETALVAKQAAVLDVLSGGRLKLGIGTGWNAVEYTALKQDFHTRGRRVEEQIALLRELWTKPLVNFEGEWHSIPDAGLNPLPVQRPIPIWLGGHADAVLQRVARMGDGWIPFHRKPADARPILETLDGYLAAADRSRADTICKCAYMIRAMTPLSGQRLPKNSVRLVRLISPSTRWATVTLRTKIIWMQSGALQRRLASPHNIDYDKAFDRLKSRFNRFINWSGHNFVADCTSVTD